MAIKLLIADDEDMIRNGMEKYIRLHTDRFSPIYLAENGDQALELILKHQPDIMLLDVQMPGKNGIEVMQEAKKLGILPVTVIISGYDEFKYAQQAVRYGARDYLLKPSRSSDILKLLEKFADELSQDSESCVAASETKQNRMVEEAQLYMQEHYMEDLTQQAIAERLGITPGYLSTIFAKENGSGFIDYLNQLRVEHACFYLQQNYLKTYEIAFKVGYHDEKYFSKVFKKIMGVSPAQYRKKIPE